ncbi:hypothetical protein LQ948_18240 [Jiella sp. MQZ9-1]|uniref:Uncharacterized protein n=1 Tax=Jiella flava TaxID=2816857 RepID=A0A939FYT0_9HYPH|nr:hypothetical protein [Jiella flava]MBO0664508.1 hypothetical protein [Jiella flava]MCD2473144.1 hypothetical protein [Jiella flava]
MLTLTGAEIDAIEARRLRAIERPIIESLRVVVRDQGTDRERVEVRQNVGRSADEAVRDRSGPNIGKDFGRPDAEAQSEYALFERPIGRTVRGRV